MWLVLKSHLQSDPIALTYRHYTFHYVQHGPFLCLGPRKIIINSSFHFQVFYFGNNLNDHPIFTLTLLLYELAWRRPVDIAGAKDSVSQASPGEWPGPKHWRPSPSECTPNPEPFPPAYSLPKRVTAGHELTT